MSILGYIIDKSVDALIAILTSGYLNKPRIIGKKQL